MLMRVNHTPQITHTARQWRTCIASICSPTRLLNLITCCSAAPNDSCSCDAR